MWRVLFCLLAFSCTVGVNAGSVPNNIVPRLIFYARPAVIPDEPSILVHTLRYITFAWFECFAACNDTAVGPLFLGTLRRTNQAVNCSLTNKNIAYAYAAYRILSQPLLSQFQSNFDAMMAEFGLDPNDLSQDTSTPTGLGNFVGFAVRDFQQHDGMNSVGDLTSTNTSGTFYGFPYADYTSYIPVNSAYNLQNPDRWQPQVEQRLSANGPFLGKNPIFGNSGVQVLQTYVTPQMRFVRAFGFTDPLPFMEQFNQVYARYQGGGAQRQKAYVQQALDVISTQANLTDQLKIEAEFFESKNLAFGTPLPFLSQVSRGTISGQTPWTVDDFVVWEFLINAAVWDAVIIAWSVKRKRDAVRPISAIRFLFPDQTIFSWGGPGKGNIFQSGAGYRSWLRTMAHSEYPSGSACMCASFAEANRQWFGSDNFFGFSFPVTAGSSGIEPGVVPAMNSTIGPFATFTDYATHCGYSRHNGGVHFTQSVVDSLAYCPSIATNAANLWRQYLIGNVTQPVTPNQHTQFLQPDFNVGTDANLAY